MNEEIQSIYQFASSGRIDEMSQALGISEDRLTQREKNELLQFCISQRLPDAALKVLLAGASPEGELSHSGRSLLASTIVEGQLEEAVLLVVMGADVNAPDINGDTPAHLAARQNAPAILELLRNNGADIHVKNLADKTPHDVAIETNSAETVLYFTLKDEPQQVPRRRITM